MYAHAIMPRNTRKVKSKLVPFNFSVLNAIVEQCGDELLPWQTDDVPDCRNALQFFDGPARVFAKYRSLFPDKYEKYMTMNFGELKALVPRFPSSKCKQLVIGAGEDIVLYIAINKINTRMQANRHHLPYLCREHGAMK